MSTTFSTEKVAPRGPSIARFRSWNPVRVGIDRTKPTVRAHQCIKCSGTGTLAALISGSSVQGLAESMELSFKETLDEGLPQLEGIVTHLTILHETFPRFQHNWGDEHQEALSLPCVPSSDHQNTFCVTSNK